MTDWLQPEAILLDVAATGLDGVLAKASSALARQTDVAVERIETALRDATRESDFALGVGIAVPHVELEEVASTAVVLVRLTSPIGIGALDGAPVDLLFVTLFPTTDPTGHLTFLAHLARLAQSRVFRDGLRRARDPGEVMALIDAAQARQVTTTRAATRAPTHGAAEDVLAIITLAGEKAVDSALVELLDQDMGHAVIADAQSVREAASREVPLFAGFRDIFGDPGGQRVILVRVPAGKVDAMTGLVRRVCEERGPSRAEIMFVPVAAHWTWTKQDDAPAPRGH